MLAPAHPEARVFINHTLNHMVGKDSQGNPKPWNFTHSYDDSHHGQLGISKSQVVERLKKERPRLPSAMYDVAAT